MIVEKLDVALPQQKLTVYNCSLRQRTAFSFPVDNYLKEITPRLNQLNLVIQQIQPFNRPLQIEISETEPLLYNVRSTKIYIGKSLAVTKGHIEHAVIRAWLKNLTIQHNNLNLFDESLADLIYYATFGSLDKKDPLTQMLPELGSAKWPQVLKNLDIYCESPWKSSEDYQRCASLDRLEHDRRQLLTMSLRPLLTSSLVSAFESLSFHEKNNFLRDIPMLIRQRDVDSEKAIEFLLNQNNSLKEGLSILKLFTDQFSLKHEASYPHRRFVAKLNQYLQSHGVSEAFAEAFFDVLIEFPDRLATTSPLFKALELASKSNLHLQIAVKDNQQIWILPSRSGLDLQIFDRVKVRQHVFFACPILKEVDIARFINNSEKLLMIKGCDDQSNYAFDLLFRYGVAEFAKKQSQLAFIQFHLPSLQQRLEDLKHIKNFFELVQNRDVTQREFQLLGWQDVQWNEKYHFYKPKAVIDAIEFFRVETPQQSN